MYKVANVFLVALLGLLVARCGESPSKASVATEPARKPDAISLLGKPLYSAEPSEKLLARYEEHRKAYEADPSADNLIWLGRFTAYQGKYGEAMKVYAKGIKEFPQDPRFYRHRGHRYISIRKLDLAIADFLEAVRLMRGMPIQVEPDGMPNARNIPVSTLQGNVWYHLGLSYFLKGDYQKANHAYLKCLGTAGTPDNIVSATHWLYMINRRIEQEGMASQYLEAVNAEMDVIENTAYHKLCLFYKGAITEDALTDNADSDAPASDAIRFGLANWYLLEGNRTRAKEILDDILAGDAWSSFGYIAAEADIKTFF
ncbi:MAG: hypothetical protein KTR24_17710 [Saprospiraceae bacterium]|nr:hypothetical protein [Saprospiraceae bacterium]